MKYLTIVFVLFLSCYELNAQIGQTEKEAAQYRKAGVKTRSNYLLYSYNWYNDTNGLIQTRSYYNKKGRLEKEETLDINSKVRYRTSYTYNTKGKVIRLESRSMETPEYDLVTEYSYTSFGELDSMISYRGDQVLYKTLCFYNGDRRLAEKHEFQSDFSKPRVTTFEYDKQGRLAREIRFRKSAN